MYRIVLIGFMGSGKSTIGNKLAAILNCAFYDTDKAIEEFTNKSISELFTTKGEAYFRDLESTILDRFNLEENFVLSAGGGLPCSNGMMEKLNSIGTTIYLKHDANTLFNRLQIDKENRPLLSKLNDAELLSFIETTLSVREPYYRKAKMELDLADQTAEKISLLLHQKS